MPVVNQSSGVKAGVVAHFASTTAPNGWIKANGAAVSRSTYAALFLAIGTTFGAGDGATTFNVPDLRGEFVRSLDDGRGVDSGRGIGSFQGQDIQSHTHNINTTDWGGSGSGWEDVARISSGGAGSVSLSAGGGGVETRPRNVAMLACIKY